MEKRTKKMMRQSLAACLLVAALLCSGCFDLETEVRFLEDGSGFVTQWVRMDAADATIATLFTNSTVEAETAAVLDGLEAAFEEAEGVQLLDHQVLQEPGKLVLRYRFMFENVTMLNRFLNDPDREDKLILPVNGTFQFMAKPAACGGQYDASFVVAPRSERSINRFDNPELDMLPADEKELVVQKYYSGTMRFRVVLPGDTQTANSESFDGRGYPVYQLKILDLFRKGLKGKVRSNVICKKGKLPEKTDPKEMDEPITMGYSPTPAELARVAAALPNFLDVLLEYDCQKNERVDIAVTFLVKEPLRAPYEFYFPMLFVAFPKMESDYRMKLSQAAPGLYRYRFETRKPIKISKLKSRYITFVREKGRYIFRMNLQKMGFGPKLPKSVAAPVLLRVKVNLPEKVRVSNAMELAEKTAIWSLTARNFENRLILEAISE